MYEGFYRFRARPFQLSPDPSFFYASRGHSRARAYLEYGLQQGEGFIVITGEVGAGKTTLVRSLMEQLQSQPFVTAHLTSTQLGADDLLRSVNEAFGIDTEHQSKARLLRELEQFLLQLSREGRRALLVVDEAQNLAPDAVEELRMLSNFQLGESSLLQSFLLGQPELRLTLQSERMRQLRQRVIATYHLGPLEAAETEAYVRHRLSTVGWENDPELTADAFSAIHEHSEGIPRRINTVCDRLLLMGYLEERHQLDGHAVEEVARELTDDMAMRPLAADQQAMPSPDGDSQGVAGHGLERLEERVSSIEETIGQLASLSRQSLALMKGLSRQILLLAGGRTGKEADRDTG